MCRCVLPVHEGGGAESLPGASVGAREAGQEHGEGRGADPHPPPVLALLHQTQVPAETPPHTPVPHPHEETTPQV